jgi:Resolvase, N terminal domain/Helix-turn-helix domain of resolvase
LSEPVLRSLDEVALSAGGTRLRLVGVAEKHLLCRVYLRAGGKRESDGGESGEYEGGRCGCGTSRAWRDEQGDSSASFGVRAAPKVPSKNFLKLPRFWNTLVVWKLDRLGRSLPHLVETVRELLDRGVGFKSLQEAIDTTTSGGKLVFHIFASLAEFERDIIRERTNAGLAAARARGRKGGRPAGVDEKKQKAALALKANPAYSIKEICEIVGISRNTYYKYTRE